MLIGAMPLNDSVLNVDQHHLTGEEEGGGQNLFCYNIEGGHRKEGSRPDTNKFIKRLYKCNIKQDRLF